MSNILTFPSEELSVLGRTVWGSQLATTTLMILA